MRCQAIKPSGDRCKVEWNLSEDGLCYFHDPLRAVERAGAQKKGQRRSASSRRSGRPVTVSPEEAPPPPETVEDAVIWASWAVHAVATGRIDAKTSHEIAYGLNALQRALEKTRLNDEIQDLKQQVSLLLKRGLKAV